MKHNNVGNKFFSEEIVFENHWRQLTEKQIDKYIDNFPGKNDFVEFYLSHNGGSFTEGAGLFADDHIKVPDDYKEIEVENFLHIPLSDDGDAKPYTYSIAKEKERRYGYSEKFDSFILSHIPFADNAGDNTFWLDKITGEVKYIDYENMGYDSDCAIIAASSFIDFCKRIKSLSSVFNSDSIRNKN